MSKDRLKKSIDYIRDDIKSVDNNAYILALAANALAAYDAKDDSTLLALQRLDKLHKDVPEWKAMNFPAHTTSMTYARGDHVTIESTALTAMAMVRTGQFTNSVNRSLLYLIKAKKATAPGAAPRRRSCRSRPSWPAWAATRSRAPCRSASWSTARKRPRAPSTRKTRT